jgi:hypothetical protein
MRRETEEPGRLFPGRVAALVFALAAFSPEARAWSPLAHQRITTEAIDTLPKGLRPFYKNHRLEIPSLGLDAPPPTEDTPDRRFTVDKVARFPFLDLPHKEEAFKARYGAEADAVGRLPWLIQESYSRLVAAFRTGDKGKILSESDALAGLVADLHNPLALTANHDGQNTEQHGLWVRFSSRFPEYLEKRLKIRTEAARYLDAPGDHVFAMVNGSYIWLDNLLYQEELARRGQSGYSDRYYEALDFRAGGLLRDLLGAAATDVGSYWYTAWTEAGRPELK